MDLNLCQKFLIQIIINIFTGDYISIIIYYSYDLYDLYIWLYLSIAIELLRIFSRVNSLRPVLESLYHRILLYPPVEERGEAIKLVQEVKQFKLMFLN